MLLVAGDRDDVAHRLTELVRLPNVTVSSDDKWVPWGKPELQENGTWDCEPTKEVILHRKNNLVPEWIQRRLDKWWLAVSANGPHWDIASGCTIRGKRGLLLVEAKAHSKEPSARGKRLDKNASTNSHQNHERIGLAIAKAAAGLQAATGGQWNLSRDHHYQLSNRFAWSWKLASLGVPVVLVYVGFLNAQDMASNDPGDKLFESEADWARILKDHSRNVVDEACWGTRLDFGAVPFFPLIRGYDQPFDPNDP